MRVDASGNVGIGTTSPGSLFSLNNIANFTTATSTFYSTGGINLIGGCFSINGTCVLSGGSSGTVTSIAAGSGLTGGTITTSGTIGLDVTASNSWTNLQQFANASTSLLSSYGPSYFGATATSTFTAAGKLGILNASPLYALDVTGFINTDQTSGYKQAGNTVLYASSTNSTTFVGQAGAAITSGTNDTAIGYQALNVATTSNDVTAIGYQALKSLINASAANPESVAVGALALTANTTGTNNTAVGWHALVANTTGSSNTAVGDRSLFSNTTGANNTAFGYQALNSNTTGPTNTAIGNAALYSNKTGGFNVGLGTNALQNSVTSSNNVALGYQALNFPNATNTVAVGYDAGDGVSGSAYQNATIVGYQAAKSLTTGSNNTVFGYQAGFDLTTGSNNTLLGYFPTTGVNVTTGSDNILIGDDVRNGLNQTGSNQLNIGNLIFGTSVGTGASLSAGNVGIASTTPWRTLDVNGTVGFKGLTNDTADSKTLCLTASNEVVSNSGSTCITSSQRFKNTILSLDDASGLAEILKLNPVSFHYNDNVGIPGEQVGFIAEQVQQVDPRLVVLDASGTPFTVRYEQLTRFSQKPSNKSPPSPAPSKTHWCRGSARPKTASSICLQRISTRPTSPPTTAASARSRHRARSLATK